MIAKMYPEEYACRESTDACEAGYGHRMTEEEAAYLALHIKKNPHTVAEKKKGDIIDVQRFERFVRRKRM